ncbi:MAG: Hemin transport system permease protein HmuU [Pseudomonadota bacterium]
MKQAMKQGHGDATDSRLAPAAWAVLMLLGAGVGLLLGASGGSTGWQWPWQARLDPLQWQIVADIRVPRSLGAWLGGALLGLAGALAQGLFRNPLADPFLLGSAPGASLGVCIYLAVAAGSALAVPGLAQLGQTGAAFLAAAGAVALTLLLSRGVQHTQRLLLAGVIVGVLLGALTSWLSLLRPELARAMQGFLLGSTGLVGWSACALMTATLLACMALSWPLARVLDALTLGQSTAQSLGMPVAAARWVLVVALSLATGAAVAQLGLIAFVGLAAPHMVRALAPMPHRWSLPLAALAGGLLLLLADLLARVLMAPQDMPVGVLTAVLGGGYLLLRLSRLQASGGAA